MPQEEIEKVVVYNKQGQPILEQKFSDLKFNTPAALQITISITPKVTKASARGYVGVEQGKAK